MSGLFYFMDLITFLILTLAVWRISSLLVNEDGPLMIFENFRYRLGVRHDNDGNAYSLTKYGELFACVWCISVWIGLIVVALWWYSPVYTTLICLPLALSAMAIGFDKYASN